MSRRLLFSVCFLSLAACAHAPKEPIAQAAQPEKTRPTTRFPASVFASRTKKPNLPLPQVVSDREYAIDAKSCHCTYKNLKTGAIATPSCDDNKLGVAKTITLSRREKMLWVDTCVVENGKPNASWSSKEDLGEILDAYGPGGKRATYRGKPVQGTALTSGKSGYDNAESRVSCEDFTNTEVAGIEFLRATSKMTVVLKGPNLLDYNLKMLLREQDLLTAQQIEFLKKMGVGPLLSESPGASFELTAECKDAHLN